MLREVLLVTCLLDTIHYLVFSDSKELFDQIDVQREGHQLDETISQ